MTTIHSTGLTGLDSQLGGGIPAGSCVVVVSQPMNAQELLALQFAAGGDGESKVFASTSRPEADIHDALAAIGLNDAGLDVKKATAKTLPATSGADRYVLDSFSDFVDQHGWDHAMKSLEGLRTALRKTGGVALITATEGIHTTAELTRLRMWADGAMEMGFDRQGFGLYPYLKVTKMRGVPDSARFLLFKETPKGLFMESTRRVF